MESVGLCVFVLEMEIFREGEVFVRGYIVWGILEYGIYVFWLLI